MLYIKQHPLTLPEILTEIFYYLTDDSALYPSLFVSSMWYRNGAPILWREVEFRGDTNRSCPQLRKFEKVTYMGQRPYAPYIFQLHISNCKISSDVLYEITRSCVNLRHLEIKNCQGLSDKVFGKIVRNHTFLSLNILYNFKNQTGCKPNNMRD